MACGKAEDGCYAGKKLEYPHVWSLLRGGDSYLEVDCHIVIIPDTEKGLYLSNGLSCGNALSGAFFFLSITTALPYLFPD